MDLWTLLQYLIVFFFGGFILLFGAIGILEKDKEMPTYCNYKMPSLISDSLESIVHFREICSEPTLKN